MARKNTKTTKQTAEKRPVHEFKPGNRWRFKPGQSGNPEGRGVENRESWRDFLNEVDDPRIAKTKLRRLMELAYRKACQGSFKHLELCIDRGWGKAVAHIESVSLHGNLADTIAEARKRAAEAKTFRAQDAKPLPALPAETVQAEPQAAPEARKPAQRVIAVDVEQEDDRPRNVIDALTRPTRESRQINVEPSFGSWRH